MARNMSLNFFKNEVFRVMVDSVGILTFVQDMPCVGQILDRSCEVFPQILIIPFQQGAAGLWLAQAQTKSAYFPSLGMESLTKFAQMLGTL